MRPRLVMLVAVVVATLIPAAPAAAAPGSSQGVAVNFPDELQLAETAHDSCGLTVRWTLRLEAKTTIVPHGRDRSEYWIVRGRITETFTSAAGLTATSVATVIEKDLRITANPDGTLTILELASGTATLYGPDGEAIARDPGQLRYTLYVDGEDVTFGEVVKGSTGRSDDFCEALVGALG